MLAASHLFSPSIPAGAEQLVDALADFSALADALRESPDDAGLARLRSLHDAIFAQAVDAVPPNLDHLDDAAAERAFVAAVRRLIHYRSTVRDPALECDTFGSTTLWAYETDLAPGGEAKLERALRAAFPLDHAQWSASDAALAEETADIAARRAVIEALSRLHPIPGSDGDPAARRAAVAALFARLYGSWPGAETTPIDLILTATSVFFLVPFEGAPEGSPMAALIEHLGTFQQSQLENFPVFGVFDGKLVETELLDGIAARVGQPVDTCASLLSTMVSVLPHEKTEQYILHDVWGHQWQAQLFRYEHGYRAIAEFERLPGIDARPHGAQHSLREIAALALASSRDGASESGGGDLGDAADAWASYLERVLGGRLAISLGALFAEVLADAVEYKFLILEPERLENLLSSSFFKEEPTKLDLTLLDLPWYFKLARRAFGRLVYRPAARRALTEALAAAFPADADRIGGVVDGLAEAARPWVDGALAGEFVRPGEDGTTNPYTRVALNFVGMQAVLNAAFRAEMAVPSALAAPLERPYDLLVFAAAAFLEADPEQHFWHIDELLAGAFPGFLQRLVAALQP